VELKAYAALAQSLLLLCVIPLYDSLTTRLTRRTLITGTSLFFVSNLLAFWCLQPGFLIDDPGWIGVAFYLWVGIFNVFIVAQFWSFAADLYTQSQGHRLFPLIAFGATAGAVAGSIMTARLVELPGFGTYGLMLFAAGFLAFATVLMRLADARGALGRASTSGRRKKPARDRSGGFRLILRHRYLLAAALLVLVLNWVNTNGENFLFGAVQEFVERDVERQGLTGDAAETYAREATTVFYGDFFFWVNLLALAMQALLASRLLRYGGFATVLLMLPIVSIGSYSAMAMFPVLGVIRAMKIAENATDYSIHNTAKQVLWLPTTTDMKYKAKAAIDTVFVRFGDVMAAATAFVATRVLSLSFVALFLLNAALAVVWLVLAYRVLREYRRLVGGRREEARVARRAAAAS
jgi:AAA family ATP:ADP antiporter